MDISNRIKQVREAKRIKQIEISDALEMNNSYYARLEKRGSKLTLEQIEKIAGALGVSVAELLGLDIIQNTTIEVEESEKDKEIVELRKRISELERVNNLLEGNAYAIESISRKLINGFIEISIESKGSYLRTKYANPKATFISEKDKHDNYKRANDKFQNESKNAIKDLVSQGYFKIILKKILLERKDELYSILRWISNGKFITERPSFRYDESKELVNEGVKPRSTDDIINEAMDMLFIPYFSGMGADKQKLNGEND